MRAEIISVGTELLLGDIVNTNAQFLARQLASLGFSVYYQTVVGDNAVRLKRLVMEARERSDVLLFTGGLGPTDDDLTKETVAEAFGDALVPDAEEIARLERFFAERGSRMTPNNLKQALVPRAGRKLPNPNGTAPGAYFRQGSKYAILLPGPPREMEPMFLEQALPILQAMQDSAIRSLTLRVFGIGESALEEKVRELLASPNPTAALYAKTGEVHIRITSKAPTAEQADNMCDEYAMLFRAAIGEYIYSDGEDLQTTVVHTLIDKGRTLATAESCTGGLLGEMVTEVPGASAVYGYGTITYANEAKHELLGVAGATLRRHGAVSGQVAAEMAFGAARLAGADYGVAVTGVAGPDGGTQQKPVGLVYVALASGREVHVKKLTMSGRGRTFVRELAALNALDMIRRAVLGLPLPGARRFTRGQQADFERQGKPRRRRGVLWRGLLAALLVAVVFALLMAALWLAGRGRPEEASQSPSASGFTYGSSEYTVAATTYVAQAMAKNPSVAGLVAMPGGRLEGLVAQAARYGQGQLAQAAAEAGVDGLAVMGADAAPAQSGSNTVVLGGADFAPLFQLWQAAAQDVSTFTFYTARDAKLYIIFSVYIVDDGEIQPDSFDPGQPRIADWQDYLAFVLGARARSLYDVPVDVEPGDSFMTLAVDLPDVEGRRLYLCGRLARPSEEVQPGLSLATRAANPLMPAAHYRENGLTAPDSGELIDEWTRWYMWKDTSNSQLQVMAGMPDADRAPLLDTAPPLYDEIPEPLPPQDAQEAPSAPEEDGGAVADDTGSADGSDVSGESGAGGTDEGAESAADGEAGADGAGGEEGEDGEDEGQSEPTPAPAPTPPPLPTPAPARPDPGRLTVTLNGTVVTDTAVKILAQICQHECPTAPEAAIQAVAVAAHSYILCRQGAGDAAPMVVGRPASVEVLQAVEKVAGRVLSGDGENPAFTPWHPSAAFGTNDPQNVWGAARGYLAPVASGYDQDTAGWRQIIRLPAETVAQQVETRLGVGIEDGALPEQWFTGVQRSENGYLLEVQVGGLQVDGFTLWQRVLAGEGGPLLPGPAFEIQFDGEDFIFICYGTGHGCGLSVAGAAGLARTGSGWADILAHYFPGAQVVEWT